MRNGKKDLRVRKNAQMREKLHKTVWPLFALGAACALAGLIASACIDASMGVWTALAPLLVACGCGAFAYGEVRQRRIRKSGGFGALALLLGAMCAFYLVCAALLIKTALYG